MKITPYTPQSRNRWDDFIATSANGTFLHLRGYMDYHADRFTDCSLMIEDEPTGRLLAVLPANREGTTLVSHRGLTYGGLIVGRRHLPDCRMAEVADTVAEWCKVNGINRIDYRPVPHIYHRYPSEADIAALLHRGAIFTDAVVSSAISLREPRVDNESMRQAVRKAEAAGLRTRYSTDLTAFHAMLCACLAERHDARPVHTLAELQLLAGRFPDNIRMLGVYSQDRTLCGGILLYITDTVVHTQYIATTAYGRQHGAIPLAVSELCKEFCGTKKQYLDFGTSVEPANGQLNKGLS
ncbi:MAG: GNAT family N-acetyltransferase, partial [Paramuribaculum sp.]|nr:GNAT family N-acetyltransferase [Paramuribaculum sp.]